MNIKKSKKYIVFFSIIIISVVVILTYVLLRNAQNTQNDITKDANPVIQGDNYQLKPNYTAIVNDEFSYRFQYNNKLFRSIKNKDDNFLILGGDIIHVDSETVKGAQLPQVSITVYNRKVLNNLSLEDWVKSVSTSSFEKLTAGSNFKYISTGFLPIEDNKIIFLVNSNPLLNNSTSVLLADNGKFLFEVTNSYISNDELFDILSEFQVKFDEQYRGLSNDELSNIKNYFKNNEEF